MEENEDVPPPTLSSLPHELQCHALGQLLSARDLSSALAVSNAWHAAVPAIARMRLQEHMLPGRSAAAAECRRPLQALHAADQLSARIGPWPRERTWRDEWPQLRISQARQLAINKSSAALTAFENYISSIGGEQRMAECFTDGGILSIETEATGSYATSVRWKLERGWPAERALETSLLASRCGSRLGQTIHERSSEFAASAWTLTANLWERAWLSDAARHASSITPSSEPMAAAISSAAATTSAAAVASSSSAAAPSSTPSCCCYLHLDGEFGLATDDPAWAVLNLTCQPGLRLKTSGFPFAMVANEQSFPSGTGFHAPITGHGTVSYELADSDIVCFLPTPACTRTGAAASTSRAGHPIGGGASAGLASGGPLVATDESIFRLPPLVDVTLVAIDEMGEWEVRPDVSVMRRLFTVTVGAPPDRVADDEQGGSSMSSLPPSIAERPMRNQPTRLPESVAELD